MSSAASAHRLNIESHKKEPLDELTTRVVSPGETISAMNSVCRAIGVTRISDITYLDRLYLPNYSVMLPGTEDSIWVYGGKGPTGPHAKASAVMEAVERYSSLFTTYKKRLIQGSYFELSKSYRRVLHPAEVVEPVREIFDENKSTIDFVAGYDLLNNEEVMVPAALVFSRYTPKNPVISAFRYSHTNGLASGNVLEEAICHALCEVIERDAVSIAELCSSSISYTILENIVDGLLESQSDKSTIIHAINHQFVDDSTIIPEVDISEAEEFEPLKFLIKRFKECEIPLLVKNISQDDIGIPTFAASSVEWITDDYGYFARGYGCHPDSRIALMRAITEVSQTRASNIQGARDDLKKIRYLHEDNLIERKWQFVSGSENSKGVKFSDISTYLNKDLTDDIKIILKRLKKAGLRRAIIVELTDQTIGVPVVRAVVPGLETFEVATLFSDKGIQIGNRAKRRFMKKLYP